MAKAGYVPGTLEAAIVELTAQISTEKDRILRNTVKGYRDSTATS